MRTPIRDGTGPYSDFVAPVRYVRNRPKSGCSRHKRTDIRFEQKVQRLTPEFPHSSYGGDRPYFQRKVPQLSVRNHEPYLTNEDRIQAERVRNRAATESCIEL